MSMFGSVTALYGGILGIAYVALSVKVSGGRRRFRVNLGDGGVPEMEKLVRTHGNFAEFVPFTLLLILLAEFGGTSQMILHLLGGGLVLARILHITGMNVEAVPNPYRAVGAVLNLFILVVASVLAILGHFNQ